MTRKLYQPNKPEEIIRSAKRMSVSDNLILRVIDLETQQVIQEHECHNAATNTLLTGIAHYLIGDGIYNQAYDMLSRYVPRYISLGTMGLTSQECDEDGLPIGLGSIDDLEHPDKLSNPAYPYDVQTQRCCHYMTERPGFGADGYDVNENHGRPYFGLGPDFENKEYEGTVYCELISNTFPRVAISFRDIVPESESEIPQTIDVVFSGMVSTGALKQFREEGKPYIFITEAGLWGKRDYTNKGDNSLLAAYRIVPPNQSNWDFGTYVEGTYDDEGLEVTPPHYEFDADEERAAKQKENQEILRRNILRVGTNQVVQIIWKIQLGGLDQLGGLSALYPNMEDNWLWTLWDDPDIGGSGDGLLHYVVMKTALIMKNNTGSNGKFRPGDKAVLEISIVNQGDSPETGIQIPITTSQFTYDDDEVPTEGVYYENGVVKINRLEINQTSKFYVFRIIKNEDMGVGYSEGVSGKYDNGMFSGNWRVPSGYIEKMNEVIFMHEELLDEGKTGEHDLFTLGDKAVFKITVKNYGNSIIQDFNYPLQGSGYLFDTDHQASPRVQNLNEIVYIDQIPLGGEITFYAYRKIEIPDLGNGYSYTIKGRTNTKTFTSTLAIPKSMVEDPESKIVMTYEIANPNEGSANGLFTIDDTIYLKFTLTNRGNLPETNVNVIIPPSCGFEYDSKKYKPSSGITYYYHQVSVGLINAGQAEYFYMMHKVEDYDLGRGILAHLNGSSDAGARFECDIDLPETLFGEKIDVPSNPDIKLTSTVVNPNHGSGANNKFITGDIVYLRITLQNKGNQVASNLELPLPMSTRFVYENSKYSPTLGIQYDENRVKIAKLTVNSSEYFYVGFTVEEKDLGEGYTTELDGTYDGEGHFSGEVEVPSSILGNSEEIENKIKFTYEVANPNQGSGLNNKFIADDNIYVKVNIQNVGAVEITDLNISIPRVSRFKYTSGGSYNPSNGVTNQDEIVKISSLDINNTAHFYLVHNVVEKDADSGVDATFDISWKPEKTTTGSINLASSLFTKEQVQVKLSGTNIVSNKPKDGNTWRQGDVVTFDINVKNEGNVQLSNVEVEEKLDGASFIQGSGYEIEN